MTTDSEEEEVLKTASEHIDVSRHLEGKQIRKKVYVKNRILNLVVN